MIRYTYGQKAKITVYCCGLFLDSILSKRAGFSICRSNFSQGPYSNIIHTLDMMIKLKKQAHFVLLELVCSLLDTAAEAERVRSSRRALAETRRQPKPCQHSLFSGTNLRYELFFEGLYRSFQKAHNVNLFYFLHGSKKFLNFKCFENG